MTTNKNIKLRANTNVLAYAGELKIKLSHGNNKPYRVIEHHNTGTAEFFKFILDCVRGHGSGKDIPYFLYLYKDANCQQLMVNLAFQLQSDSEVEIVKLGEGPEDDYAIASFTTLIASNFISGKSFQSVKITNSKGTEYARISLDDAIRIEGSNTNVAIDWVLTLGNRVFNNDSNVNDNSDTDGEEV